jgi:hypothetical protein
MNFYQSEEILSCQINWKTLAMIYLHKHKDVGGEVEIERNLALNRFKVHTVQNVHDLHKIFKSSLLGNGFYLSYYFHQIAKILQRN